jgi:hypothetical protein
VGPLIASLILRLPYVPTAHGDKRKDHHHYHVFDDTEAALILCCFHFFLLLFSLTLNYLLLHAALQELALSNKMLRSSASSNICIVLIKCEVCPANLKE